MIFWGGEIFYGATLPPLPFGEGLALAVLSPITSGQVCQTQSTHAAKVSRKRKTGWSDGKKWGCPHHTQRVTTSICHVFGVYWIFLRKSHRYKTNCVTTNELSVLEPGTWVNESTSNTLVHVNKLSKNSLQNQNERGAAEKKTSTQMVRKTWW